jgi:protein SCO1/2
VILLGLVLAACSARPEAPLAGARIGGPFSLVDQDGSKVSDRDFAGRYRIVYFGYSHCPDVCPTDLQKIGEGLTRFEKTDPERGARVQPIFITVDPDRDTPDLLGKYVPAFDPRFVGLWGDEAATERAKKEFHVYAQQRPGKPGEPYAVDHSAHIYVLDRQGQMRLLLPPGSAPAAIASDLRILLNS